MTQIINKNLLTIRLNHKHKFYMVIPPLHFRGYLASTTAVIGKYSFVLHRVSLETT